MPAKRYAQRSAGEWVRPVRNGFRFACCDCGMVHRLDFDVQRDGAIVFRAFRDEKATARLRSWKGERHA